MGLGSSLSGISFGGLASGIDTDSIVSRLIQLERIPIQRLQRQQVQLSAKMGAFQQFKSLLTGMSAAAGGLNTSSAFNPIAATSSNLTTATISASGATNAGIYALAVSKLAQAQKVSTGPQTNTTTALGQSGVIAVNGKAVTIEATDTLQNIAQKINSAGAGATASLIDGGAGQAYLSITSAKTGAGNRISVTDVSGTAATGLGLVGGAESFRSPTTGGGYSNGFSSTSTTIASSMSATGLPTSMSFALNEVSITVDPNVDSIQAIATKINISGSGATAAVETVTENGSTSYRLKLTGVSTVDDSSGILKDIGLMQRDYSHELLAAQDAAFTLDNVALTSSTNTVTTAIPGATITLLKANLTTPETSTLTLSRDNDGIKTKVKAFMDAYNGVIDFVKANSTFDKDSFESGLLFGDGSTQQVESTISGLMFNSVANLNSSFSNLTQLGFSFDSDGKLALNEATLDTAIGTNSDAVGNLFRALGTSTTNSISYVSSTEKSRASTAAGYAIDITQLATKGSVRTLIAQDSPGATQEILTFNGALFGNTAYGLVIPAGATQNDIVNQINSDSKLREFVSASVDGGRLKIESKKYGTSGNFTVKSDQDESNDNSGIGTTPTGTLVTGLDIAGTINGEAATGNGQFLTGKSGNTNTDGIQILYNGVTTGAVGNLKFTKGVASQMLSSLTSFTDSVNGLLTSNDQSLQQQVDSISESITSLNARIAQKEIDLRQKFSRMEQAIAQLQSQQSRLGALSR